MIRSQTVATVERVDGREVDVDIMETTAEGHRVVLVVVDSLDEDHMVNTGFTLPEAKALRAALEKAIIIIEQEVSHV